MRMPEPVAQRTCSTCAVGGSKCSKCETDRPALQRKTERASECAASVPDDFLRSLGPGQPLDSATRAFFEPRFGHDFSHVRVHADAKAAESARSVNALAYTVGNDIVFGERAFSSVSKGHTSLLAHELTHVLQQTGVVQPRGVGAHNPRVKAGSHAVLQRSLTEAQLASTPDTTIRRDPDYLDNRITRIEFYTAELAVIHYEDGSQLRLGLVPGQIQPPVVGVDYRTRRSEHLLLDSPGPGQTRFLPRARQIQAPGMTIGQVTEEFGRTITYRLDASSHRIVPTEVNDITAPRLCEVLRRAEAEYVSATDELARGMIKALEILEIALIIASFIPTAGESAGAAAARGAGAAGTAEAGVLGRAVSVLRRFFIRLLRSGGTETITVEGVGFGGVRAVMSEGRVMTVFRNTIVNAERIPGQGRLIHSAFEQAAVAAAREAGATSVRVALETVINPQWATYLKSLGYAIEVIPTASGGFSRVLIRTLAL